eukprot:TRINITY_DN1530_c0_g2_i1.p1 TRINITY_DN1530_c0_g2~~TRINITY_DN1530_c0_g2_i1.p1  ORF type:complete len:1069 (-),score=174.29 TRINITY_DN1530_c0_g2_i1:65-3271(-)
MDTFRSGPSSSTRRINIGDPALNAQYISNKISNTKYTLITFIPKNLWLQFGTFMNVYFLVIACLQLISLLSPVSPVTIWVPLIFIFCVSATKEALDDLSRARTDEKANSRIFHVLDEQGQRIRKKSEDLRVGDILWIQENEEIPCDIFILKSSDANGLCYIQTANLDGETDYKPRHAIQFFQRKTEEEIVKIRAVIEAPPPNANIYNMDSRLILPGGETVSLDTSNVCLQTTHLKNTHWVIAVVGYTGDDSKFGQNKSPPASKFTKLDTHLNRLTVIIFCLMLVLVVSLGIYGNTWNNPKNPIWYLDLKPGGDSVSWWTWIIIPVRFLLLISLIIPISLKVSLDVVKYAYAMFINWDEEMYDPETNTFAKATTTAIAEDLAQVEYVFSDKTGTLTENIMKLKHIFSKGQVFDLDEPNALVRLAPKSKKIQKMLQALALCHSVVTEKISDYIPLEDEEEVPKLEGIPGIAYKASSPDEEALVMGAVKLGVCFAGRDLTKIQITSQGIPQSFTILHTLEFTSDRRRMGILLRDEAGKCFLFMKGSDDAIFRRSRNYNNVDAEFEEQVENFSRCGLRTLVVAYREIPEEEVEEILGHLQEAKTEIKNRSAALTTVYDIIERDLIVLGVLAIEDKLQEKVPETIRALREADIKVWMLTGDKFSTAKQIALSCSLITSDSEDCLLAIQESSSMNIAQCIDYYLQSLERKRDSLEENDMSLIIEGKWLQIVLDTMPEKFIRLSTHAKTVICCRVTPQQKASVVRLIKEQGYVTLSIGDGGNDVAMIQEASLGVGIVGREGLQAARASDYSFGKFRFLRRLLFVHGNYSYTRTAFVGHYCFHKSLYLALMQIFFGFYSGFSGSSLFNSFSLATYNVFFTGLPVLFLCLDRHAQPETLESCPRLYKETQKGKYFSWSTISYWALRTLVQSAIAFFFLIYIFGGDYISSIDGSPLDQESLSMIIFSAAVCVQIATIIVESNSITFMNALIIGSTFFSYWIMVLAATVVPQLSIFGIMFRLFSNLSFWLAVILVTFVSVAPIVVLKTAVATFYPWEYQKVERAREQSSYTSLSPLLLG